MLGPYPHRTFHPIEANLMFDITTGELERSLKGNKTLSLGHGRQREGHEKIYSSLKWQRIPTISHLLFDGPLTLCCNSP